MPTRFAVQLQKTIVIHVEADTEADALERCMEKDKFNDSWYYAEPIAVILEQEDAA